MSVFATSVLSSSSLVSPPSMGSVSRDYRCPWCGRIGAGGYGPDAVFPDVICLNGLHSCQGQMVSLGVNRATYRERQLHGIAQAQVLPFRIPGIALCMAEYLCKYDWCKRGPNALLQSMHMQRGQCLFSSVFLL